LSQPDAKQQPVDPRRAQGEEIRSQLVVGRELPVPLERR
jgi:hypothetical protein